MKIKNTVGRRWLACLNLPMLLATLLSSAGAATLTWNGSVSGSWAATANWTGGTIGTGDDLIFTGSANPATFMGTVTRVVNSVTFQNTTAAAFSIALAGAADGSGTARNLTFQSGNTGITIDSGDAYAHTLGVGGANVNLQGNLTVTHNGTKIFTINRPVIGAFTLTKSGPGPLTLSGGNTYSGGTVISSGGGTLTIGGAGTLAAGNIANDGSFICNSSADATLNGVLSGAGSWEQKGPGALTLVSATANTFTGNLTLSAGILKAAYGSTTLGVRNANLGVGAATLTLNGGELQCAHAGNANYNRNTTVGGNATITSSMSTGTDGFTYTFGTLAIGGQTLTVQASTQTTGTAGVTFGAATFSGAPSFTVNNNGLGTTTLLTLNSTVDNGGFTPTFGGTGNAIVTGIISGNGGLTKSGAGTLTVNGANTYGGSTRIGAGTLTLGNASALQSSTLDLDVADSGTLNFGTLTAATFGGLAGARNLALTNTTPANVIITVGNNNSNTVFSGVLSDGGGLTKVGTGTLTLTGANTFTNRLAISTGTLSVPTVNNAGSPGPMGSAPSATGFVVLMGTSAGGVGTLEYTGDTATSTKRFTLGVASAGTGVFQIDNAGATLSFSGALNGPGNLVKTGPGGLALANVNTYSGSTTVSNGTLLVNGSTHASSAVSVASGATLGGSGLINGSLTVASGATLQPGLGGTDTAALTVNSNVALAGTTIIGLNRTNASTSARLVVTGTLTNGGTLTVTNVGDPLQGGDSFTLFTLYAVPGGSFSATNLPPLGTGTNWWQTTANATNVVILVNRAPVAGAASYNRAGGTSLKIAITNLLTHVTDADGNTPALVNVSATTNGATLLTDADFIYVPTNYVADAFTYTVTDGFGGTNSGTVTIPLVTAYGQETGALTVTNSTVTAQFAGVVGLSYIVQRGTNVTFGGVVSNFPAMDAPPGGLFSVTDDFDDILTGTNVPAQAFYRLQYNPAP